MAAFIAVVVFVLFWFGIARQLKKNGRGWFGRNIIAGVGASFAFSLVVIVDISLSDPAGQLAEKQASKEAEVAASVAEPIVEPVEAVVDISESMPSKAAEWYEGGTLHQGNGLDWQQASYENKLATAGDLIAAAYTRKKLSPELQKAISGTDDMKVMAQELVKQLDEAFKAEPNAEENRKLFSNQQVAYFAAMIMAMSGWLE